MFFLRVYIQQAGMLPTQCLLWTKLVHDEVFSCRKVQLLNLEMLKLKQGSKELLVWEKLGNNRRIPPQGWLSPFVKLPHIIILMMKMAARLLKLLCFETDWWFQTDLWLMWWFGLFNLGENSSDAESDGYEASNSESLENDMELKLHILGSKMLWTQTCP